jgi:hypothetical protein
MTRIGITGHQGLQQTTRNLVADGLARELRDVNDLHGVTSLAEGADQIFAEQVLGLGGKLTAVIPAAQYEDSFVTDSSRMSYWAFRDRADEIVELPYDVPCEQAYWAAGQHIVNMADILLAVWDGKPSGGLGGTADVVAYAQTCGVLVRVLWPPGARRG